jgi:hypothetical protein
MVCAPASARHDCDSVNIGGRRRNGVRRGVSNSMAVPPDGQPRKGRVREKRASRGGGLEPSVKGDARGPVERQSHLRMKSQHRFPKATSRQSEPPRLRGRGRATTRGSHGELALCRKSRSGQHVSRVVAYSRSRRFAIDVTVPPVVVRLSTSRTAAARSYSPASTASFTASRSASSLVVGAEGEALS